MRLQQLLIPFFIFLSFSSSSQSIYPSTLNATGGSYDNTSSYYHYAWSFGEMCLIETYVQPNVILTNGVLQPGTDRIVISGYTDIFGPDEYKIFPNPTTGKFEFDFNLDQRGPMTFTLIDATGKVLETQTFVYNAGGLSKIVRFDISRYPNGNYTLIASLQPNAPTRRSFFKIIKMPK